MSVTTVVSVLIRTRNRRDLLIEALQSVLRQTHEPIEIVIVNDGGEDYSAALPQAGVGRTLRWLDNTLDQGRCSAANTALLAATGDYCLFLDDDDWLDPTHIANLMQALQQDAAKLLAYSFTRVVTADGSKDETSFNGAFDAQRLLAENYIPIHAALFSRALAERGCRFDTNFDRYEDWDFWLQALQHSDFVCVPEFTANYRIASGSGFGIKDEDAAQYRAALYRKWLPRWTDAQLLALLDRARAWPTLAALRSSLDDQVSFVALLKQQETQLNAELLRRLAVINQQADNMTILSAELFSTQELLTESERRRRLAEDIGAGLRRDLDLIYQSRSWKLTRPLRLFTRVQGIYRIEGVGGVWRRVSYRLLRKGPKFPVVKADMPVATAWQPLEFPQVENPRISIVIPVYNKYEFTFHCLKSILANSSEQSYEVIVVDDCSSDATQKQLATMKGITVLRNEQNAGFIRSCNRGAEAARGKYLVLFNNDTEPQPLWLTALVNTFRDRPDCGMVGARLLYPDGKLQEAGGIVWRDGSAWNFGRNDDPNKPEYSYLRQVDYCSGACLMLPLADYMALGMFDTLYLPAYYEDTDLAFKVRAAGKKVYYQPLARVIHFEGISNGTDTGGGVKAYQVANQQKFFARWEQTLLAHRPHGEVPHYEKERHVGKRVMVVGSRILMPDRDSGSLRMFNLLKIFQSLGYKVSFFAENLMYDEKYTPMLQAIGVECFYVPYTLNIVDHLKYLGSQYQVVLLSRADNAEKYSDAVLSWAPQAQLLYDTVDLHFLREQRLAELSGDRSQMEAAAMRKVQELGSARKAHKTLVVSPVEIDLFRVEAPDVNVALLSNIHAAEGRRQGYAERRDILFIGSFEHPPNTDAMHWFIDEVFPLLHAQKPDIRLRIIGGHAPSNLTAKASEHIEFTGFVEDIEPFFNSIRLSIAPLRYGAGAKGKINSSMSFGVPVVGTTVAAEGMGLVNGQDVQIADEPTEFAQQIVRAYDDEKLWYALSDAGIANIERCFSFELATQQLREILDEK